MGTLIESNWNYGRLTLFRSYNWYRMRRTSLWLFLYSRWGRTFGGLFCKSIFNRNELWRRWMGLATEHGFFVEHGAACSPLFIQHINNYLFEIYFFLFIFYHVMTVQSIFHWIHIELHECIFRLLVAMNRFDESLQHALYRWLCDVSHNCGHFMISHFQ